MDDKIIEVKLSGHEDAVRVSVFNTGEPIPESDLDKIWVKFYKVDKARTGFFTRVFIFPASSIITSQ